MLQSPANNASDDLSYVHYLLKFCTYGYLRDILIYDDFKSDFSKFKICYLLPTDSCELQSSPSEPSNSCVPGILVVTTTSTATLNPAGEKGGKCCLGFLAAHIPFHRNLTYHQSEKDCDSHFTA